MRIVHEFKLAYGCKPRELAKRIGVNVTTVYNWHKKGEVYKKVIKKIITKERKP